MIYFAQADGTDFVKIGFTAGDPVKRLSELQTGCPHKLGLLASIEGSEQDEGKWHKEFASDRVTGEWFKASWRLMLAIARAEASRPIPAAAEEGAVSPVAGGWWSSLLNRAAEMYPGLYSSLQEAGDWILWSDPEGVLFLQLHFYSCDRSHAEHCARPSQITQLRWALESILGVRKRRARVLIRCGFCTLADAELQPVS